MAEQKAKRRGNPGPGGGPNKHGFQRPKNLKVTLSRLVGYIGKQKYWLILVALCLLVTVHELGHYLAGRALGFKIALQFFRL